ncbi:hypothetical protein [Nostoc sp. CCY 9925]|uniref:hypothetical protein n=1 Tax=Nostoc sp. CCY 9925 TaxID=3103865 RepID=UPI0039C73867
MQVLENNALFTEVSAEQSQVVSGGKKRGHSDSLTFDLDAYLFVLGAGVVFGNPTLTSDEIQVGWEYALGI